MATRAIIVAYRDILVDIAALGTRSATQRGGLGSTVRSSRISRDLRTPSPAPCFADFNEIVLNATVERSAPCEAAVLRHARGSGTGRSLRARHDCGAHRRHLRLGWASHRKSASGREGCEREARERCRGEGESRALLLRNHQTDGRWPARRLCRHRTARLAQRATRSGCGCASARAHARARRTLRSLNTLASCTRPRTWSSRAALPGRSRRRSA